MGQNKKKNGKEIKKKKLKNENKKRSIPKKDAQWNRKNDQEKQIRKDAHRAKKRKPHSSQKMRNQYKMELWLIYGNHLFKFLWADWEIVSQLRGVCYGLAHWNR